MGKCPFCGSKVPEDLITFGGACPKCFADIPGEEAATDPGEDVKAAQARKDQLRTTLKTLLPFALLVPVIGVLGLAAIYMAFLRPSPQVVLLDFDELDAYPMPELVAAAPVPAPRETRPRPASPKPATPVAVPAPQGDGVAAVEPAPKPAQAGGMELGLDVSANRRGVVLDDDEAIQKMIGQQMAAQAPRLNGCYEKELKSDENLAGRWRVSFVVGKDGRVQSPGAEALSGSVPSFEACLTSELARWSFQRIVRDQPVRKTFTFRPAY